MIGVEGVGGEVVFSVGEACVGDLRVLRQRSEVDATAFEVIAEVDDGIVEVREREIEGDVAKCLHVYALVAHQGHIHRILVAVGGGDAVYFTTDTIRSELTQYSN